MVGAMEDEKVNNTFPFILEVYSLVNEMNHTGKQTSINSHHSPNTYYVLKIYKCIKMQNPNKVSTSKEWLTHLQVQHK